jgi:transcription antitermination factor NusG
MGSGSQIGFEVGQPAVPCAAEPANWFAVHTYPRHEKRVVAELEHKGIESYLPLVEEEHYWSDRKKAVELPLFSCYAFVRLAPTPQKRVAVLRVPGVIGFVGPQNQGTPIPEQEIESVRRLLENEIKFKSYPFLKIGQRVRVRGGALDGVEGILMARNGEKRLVVSVATIERSLAISVEGYHIEAA